ncbi:hypothetical protein ACHAPK_011490, partial [Fusarium culmorum]
MRRFFREKRGEDPNVPDNKGPESEGIVLPEALPEMPSPSNGPVSRREPINGSATEETMRVRLAQMQQPDAQHTWEIKQEASAFSEFPSSISMPYHPLQQPQEQQPDKRPETLSKQENASWAVGNSPGGLLSCSATARGRDHTPKSADDPAGATQFDHTQPPTTPLHGAPRPTLGPFGTRRIPQGYHALSLEPNNVMETSHGFASRRTSYKSEPLPTPNNNWAILRSAPADTIEPLSLPQQDRSAQISLQIDPSPQPPATMGEITRANVVFRIDGPVYTSPDCVKGVPLVKIGKDHSYWEDSWKDIRSLIELEVEEWQTKYKQARRAWQPVSYSTLHKYRAKVTKFLISETGPISPYQLLSKSIINCRKHNIISYDTLFRLVTILSELENFNLDISPVNWLRQRLHELIEVQGTHFKLPKAKESFYNDPKLIDLRSKHG